MLVRIFSVMVAASIILIMGVLGFMAADRRIPIEIISAQATALEARPGGMLEFDVYFIQHRRCHILTERRLVGSEGRQFPLPPVEYGAGIGPVEIEQKIRVVIPIPTDIPFGIATYEATTFYKCNILHSIWPIISAYNPIFFEVVPL